MGKKSFVRHTPIENNVHRILYCPGEGGLSLLIPIPLECIEPTAIRHAADLLLDS